MISTQWLLAAWLNGQVHSDLLSPALAGTSSQQAFPQHQVWLSDEGIRSSLESFKCFCCSLQLWNTVLTQDIFCLHTKFNPRFQHAVAKDSIAPFISIHVFRNSPWDMLRKSSLATWFTWKAWQLTSFCLLNGISCVWTVIKVVSGHEILLVTPCPVSYHTPVRISMKPSSGTSEFHWDLEIISNIK